MADGSLLPRIELEAPWTEIGEVARRLIDRDYAGKAVHVSFSARRFAPSQHAPASFASASQHVA